MLIAGGILSAALPLAADEWADPETGITWKYSLADGVATVKGTTMSPDEYKAVESLAVPDTFDGAPVTSIGGDAFAWYYSLKEITIPETVTNIGGYAFRYCTNLVSFAFPPNLERIGDGAFANTDICPDLVVPDSVTHIGDCAFSGCRNLKRVTLPVAAINAAYASGGFSDKFFEVAVKDRTPVIEELTITGEGDIVNYASSVYGELAGTLKKLVLSSGITRVGAWAFYEFKELEEIVFPETLLSIGGSAFESCEKLPSVTLPESLLDLGGESFMRC